MSRFTSIKDKKRRSAAASKSASFDQDPPYLPKVIQKVKKHPKLNQLFRDEMNAAGDDTKTVVSNEWAKQKAKELTEYDGLYINFSHLRDDYFATQLTQFQQEATATDYGRAFLTESERGHAQQRAAIQLNRAADIPIKLQLTMLKRDNLPPRFVLDKVSRLLAMAYGPLHAALVVGDVTLEWDDSSLVVPEQGMIYPEIQVDITSQTTVVKQLKEKEARAEAALARNDMQEQIDLMYDISVDRAKLIDALIDVVANYNKYHKYDMWQRNCQTFVKDAMKAMGIKNPPKLTGKLQQYFIDLKKGKAFAPEDFKTHEELDRYIRDSKGTGEFDQLIAHDKEYLLCLYFQFHLQTLEEDKDEDCKIPGCMKAELERSMEGPLLLEKYLSD